MSEKLQKAAEDFAEATSVFEKASLTNNYDEIENAYEVVKSSIEVFKAESSESHPDYAVMQAYLQKIENKRNAKSFADRIMQNYKSAGE